MTLIPGETRLLKCPHCGKDTVSAGTIRVKCRHENCQRTFHPEKVHIVNCSVWEEPQFVTADKIPKGTHNHGTVKP